jgi:ABC-2 type transport system permease protein
MTQARARQSIGAPLPEASPRLDLSVASRRGWVRLIWHQVRFDTRALLRDRQARFFTIAMPVGFLVLFVAIFGNGSVRVGGHFVRTSTYYVANLTAFGIVDSAFMALSIGLVAARETGVLRRRQATPQPPWMVVTARSVTCVATTASIATLLLVLGRVAYGATVPLSAVPALALAVVVGCTAGCTLAFAATTIVRSNDSAQPVVMGIAMPLFFISGVFVPWSLVPTWLHRIAQVFPIRHLSLALLTPFVHAAGTSPWSFTDLAIVAAWGVGGLLVAVRAFRWAPQV